MKEQIEEVLIEFPESTPILALFSAREEAFVAMVAKRFGRKAALEYLEDVERCLGESTSLDNVALIRGESSRQFAARNRRVAANWWRGMHGKFSRAIARS